MPRSYKHTKTAQRAHIPSREEAGVEQDNPAVRQRETLHLPKNPVVHRGQDPELFWMNKYGADDTDDRLKIDIRSLYRHEHIAPEKLIDGLHRVVVEKRDADQMDLFTVNETFGNALERDELEKAQAYYQHSDGWTNRLIQGDSLLTMTSLLEREGMAGRVQMIYIDPPYGIKYNSNWQVKLNDRNVKDGADDHLSGEPEMIKAFRDTWELGIHSYLSYLRDRLLVAKELLTESGSCFVQISDENVHLVRCLMDEVFGSENHCALIPFQKTSGASSPDAKVNVVGSICDYVVWYAVDYEKVKYRQLFVPATDAKAYDDMYTWLELPTGERRRMKLEERTGEQIAVGRRFSLADLTSQNDNQMYPLTFRGKQFLPKSRGWRTTEPGMKRLLEANRIEVVGNSPRYVQYADDFPVSRIQGLWTDTGIAGFASDKVYVVQTNTKVIQRCLLMCTDPGDLVLDPTCGGGTTAYVAEQWGRRWITIDTSRIALNIAKTRLMTAAYPYYHLHSDVEVRTEVKEGKTKKTITPHPNPSPKERGVLHPNPSPGERGGPPGDLRQGFVYEEVPHITLKSLANDEPPATETLYDKPYVDNKRLRVSGPFTVETLQDFEPVSPAELEQRARTGVDDVPFEQRVFAHLQSAGVMNGMKGEKAVFTRVDRLASAYLHAEGFYPGKAGEKKAYFHIGPKFGTVSRQAVNEAIKECRQRGDADWLVILGFSFDTDITTQEVTRSVGSFMVTKTRMHDDLMQDGLMKKPRNVGSFITIGEPDVRLVDVVASGAPAAKRSNAKGRATDNRQPTTNNWVQVEIAGLDIYDPISDTVKARDVEDIAYWMVDDDYDGSNFVVKQLYFCGGDKDEFAKWRKGLSDLAKQSTKKKAEQTLRIEIDDEAFDRLYGFQSHPIAARKGQKIAVRVVSQFGEESTKVLEV
jgi:adenine-specific DNA-methyltransferase